MLVLCDHTVVTHSQYNDIYCPAQNELHFHCLNTLPLYNIKTLESIAHCPTRKSSISHNRCTKQRHLNRGHLVFWEAFNSLSAAVGKSRHYGPGAAGGDIQGSSAVT